jgi:hypothetical protein
MVSCAESCFDVLRYVFVDFESNISLWNIEQLCAIAIAQSATKKTRSYTKRKMIISM